MNYDVDNIVICSKSRKQVEKIYKAVVRSGLMYDLALTKR